MATKKSTAVPQESSGKVSEPMISVVFKDNRKFDLHIGREMVTFKARERKEIPEKWLKHKDWQNVAKYFVIKGV